MHKGLVASKACANRVRQRDHDLHKQRLRNMKPQIDTKKPETMHLDHLRNNLKREQMIEERYHEIDRDNRILLHKMSDLMKNKSMPIAPRPEGGISLNRDTRKQQLMRITQENNNILRRIQTASPVYNHVDWENSYAQSYHHLKNACEYDVVLPSRLNARKGMQRSSSLTPLGASGKMTMQKSGSAASTSMNFAPGEANQQEFGEDMRYVLRQNSQFDGIHYYVEMATDGRSLAITAYDAANKSALELLVNERNHRRLYRDFNGDYSKIAKQLRIEGQQLWMDVDFLGYVPPPPPPEAVAAEGADAAATEGAPPPNE
eukprot:TRINITY_DN42005_c0_g1_i1.p1 TRINITY_DN42005_c0_g1~~TRINITY_DN42005_c0_g1_i1.p1  ORF type:complete len:317 (+),score=68.44 TRINITY_DN42005_c0_g1_i1:100-1050(+)